MNTNMRLKTYFLALVSIRALAPDAYAQGTAIRGNRTITGSFNYCVDAGGTDAYACSISPAPPAYNVGTVYSFKANTANTGASSVNLNSLGAIAIKKIMKTGITTDTATGDIPAGAFVQVMYDGTNMQMISSLGTIGDVRGPGAAVTQNRLSKWATTSGDSLSESACTEASGDLSCTGGISTGVGGSVQGYVALREAPANGTNKLVVAGAPDQSADVCVESAGAQPAGAGYYLVTNSNSNSRTLDGGSITCRQVTWSQIVDVREIKLPAAVCNDGTTAASGFSAFNSGAPSKLCVVGTNIVRGVLEFDAATDEAVQGDILLPSTWTGAVDVKFNWEAAATTGNAVLGIQTTCRGQLETGDPAWNTAQTVTDATNGTTLQSNFATITNIDMTNCSAGENFHFRLFRDADAGADTMSGDLRLIDVTFTVRRTL